MLLASGQANFGVKMDSFLAGTKRVREEITSIKNIKARVDVSVGLQTGTMARLRESVKTNLGFMSRSMNIEVDARLKPGSLQAIKDSVKAAAQSASNTRIQVQATVSAAAVTTIERLTLALERLDALPKGPRSFAIDIQIKAGAELALQRLRRLLEDMSKRGYTIRVNVLIDNAVLANLQQLNNSLQQAITNVNNLRQGLGRIPSGAANAPLGAGARGNVRSYDDAVGHLINTVRRFLVGYLGVKLLIDGFRALKDATIGYNVTLAQTQASLSAMLDNNRKKAMELITQLQMFAERTPYRFSDLMPIVIQLRLAKISADRLMPSLSALGNIAATTGKGADGIARMANSLRDMNARGRITGEEVREMSRQAVPVYDYIAKSWNISVQKAQEYVRKGLIPAKEATDAIIKNAAADPKFMGRLEQQSKTLPGALSNVGDTLQRIVGTSFTPVYDNMTKLANKVADFVARKDFQAWAKEAVERIIYTVSIVSQAIGTITALVIKFRAILFLVLDACIARFIIMTIIGIGPAIAAMVRLTGTVIYFGASAILALQSLNPWIKVAILAIILYGTNWLHVRDIVNGVVTGMLEGMKNVSVKTAEFVELIAKIPIIGPKLLGDQTGLADGIRKQWDDTIHATDAGLQALSEKLDSGKSEVGKLLDGFINPLNITGLIDMWSTNAAKAAASVTSKLEAIPDYSGHFTKNAGADAAAKKAAREALAREKDALRDNARAWEIYAKAVTDSAKAQVAAMKDLKETVSGFFQDTQKKLIDLGIVSDPLAPMIASFERLLGLGDRMKGVVGYVKAVQDEANRVAIKDGSNLEKLQKFDGKTPQGIAAGMMTGPTSNIGLKIAENAQKLQDKYGSKLQESFSRSCDRLADLTVRGVTSAYNKIMGPRPGDTAAATMRRFQAAGIGSAVTAGMALQPGGLLYSSTLAHGTGHVQTVGPNGQRLDQYGANKFKQSDFQWYVPPPGAPTFSARNARLQKDFGVKPTMANTSGDPNDIGSLLGENFSNSLTNIRAIPAAWGKVVQETKDSQVRYLFQTQLTSKKFQDTIDEIAIKTLRIPESLEGARARVIAMFRGFANAADAYLNVVTTIGAAEENIRNYRKTSALAGKENDPAAVLAYERRGQMDKAVNLSQSGDPKIAAAGRRGIDTLNAESTQLAKSVLDVLNAATQKSIDLANAQSNAQAEVALRMGNTTESIAGYESAIARLNIKLKNESELYDLIHSKDPKIAAGAAKQAADRTASEIEQLQISTITALTLEYAKNSAAIKDRIALLAYQNSITAAGSVNEETVSAMVEAQAKRRDAYNKTLNAYTSVLGEVAAAQLAAADGQTAFNQSMEQSGAENEARNITSLAKAVRDLNDAKVEAAARDKAVKSGFSFDPDQARNIALAQARAQAGNDYLGGRLNTFGDIQKSVDNTMSRFDLNKSSRDVEELNKTISDAAQAQLTWNNLTVQANAIFQTTFGNLKNLTDKDKKEYIDSVTVIESASYATNQLKTIRSDAAKYQEELDARALTNAKKVGEAAQLVAKYKKDDADAIKLGIVLTKEETDVLNAERSVAIKAAKEVDASHRNDKKVEAAKQALEQLRGIFASSFEKIYTEGFKNLFSNVLDGVVEMLNKLAAQILASEALKLLLKMIPGVGNYLGGMSNAASSNSVIDSIAQAATGAIFGGSGRAGSSGSSVGDYNAPYVAQESAQRTAASIVNSPTAESVSAMKAQSSISSSAQTVVYNYNIAKVAANDPAKFATEVKRQSDGQQARKLTETVQYGERKL